MVENPLFYQNIVPLDRARHRDLRLVRDNKPVAFAMTSHIIPAVVDEFVAAARFLPILFIPAAPHPSPVFLVGTRTGQNLLVDALSLGDSEVLASFLAVIASGYVAIRYDTGRVTPVVPQ